MGCALSWGPVLGWLLHSVAPAAGQVRPPAEARLFRFPCNHLSGASQPRLRHPHSAHHAVRSHLATSSLAGTDLLREPAPVSNSERAENGLLSLHMRLKSSDGGMSSISHYGIVLRVWSVGGCHFLMHKLSPLFHLFLSSPLCRLQFRLAVEHS